MPEFIPGIKVNEDFYKEIVKPILDAKFPDIQYSAGRLGAGSDVLGYDTKMSTDHDWGPKLTIILSPDDHQQYAQNISNTLSLELPREYRGYSTEFGRSPEGSIIPLVNEGGPIQHEISIETITSFQSKYIPVKHNHDLTPVDWLVSSQQGLLEITAGKVFHDGLGALKRLRKKLAYFPEPVWKYILASGWMRIGQEDHLCARAGYVGDEIGARILVSRLVRDIMHLCFLMEKTYAPYPKWFGSAFRKLDSSEKMTPLLMKTLEARNWQDRNAHFVYVCEVAVEMHNTLGITEPVQSKAISFHGRPFKVIDGSSIADTIWNTIEDEEVRKLPKYVGSVDQFSDSTDIRSREYRLDNLRGVYLSK